MDPNDLIRCYLTIYDGYHGRKENISYLASAAYLAGVVAFLTHDPPSWQKYSPLGQFVFFLVLIISGLLGFFFVLWQFQKRREASDIFDACVNLATLWLTTSPSQDDLQPTCSCCGQLQWPRALDNEIKKAKGKKRGFWIPRDITIMAIIIGALSVLYHVGFFTWLLGLLC